MFKKKIYGDKMFCYSLFCSNLHNTNRLSLCRPKTSTHDISTGMCVYLFLYSLKSCDQLVICL